MTRKLYTPEEDAYLKKVYGILPTSQIAETLNRSRGSVSARASTLGIKANDRIIKYDGGTKKECECCHKILPIENFKYLNKGKYSESTTCNECRKNINYQKAVNKKLKEMRQKAGILSEEELMERDFKKNEQTFICSVCGEELPGKFFVFKSKKSNEIDNRCRKCRSKINNANKYKNIMDGKCW